MRTKRLIGIFLGVLLLAGGCAVSKQARRVTPSGYLGEDVYARMTAGKDDQSLLLYRKANVDPGVYSRVMIEQVAIFKPKGVSQEELADLQKLAGNFYQYLREELGKDYQIVDTPGPGTVLYRVAITAASDSNRFFEVMSLVPPYGLGMSVAQDFITGKPSGVGEISMEMKASDALSGELLGAAMDRRVGGKHLSSMFATWDDADHAMRYWAKRVRYVNCQGKGAQQCEKP